MLYVRCFLSFFSFFYSFSVSTTGMLAGIKMSHAAVTSLCRSMKLACELYPSRHIALCLDPYCGLGFALWCLSRSVSFKRMKNILHSRIHPVLTVTIYKCISVYILVIIRFSFLHRKLKSTRACGSQPSASIKYETRFALTVSYTVLSEMFAETNY